jgi:hypothetical protein
MNQSKQTCTCNEDGYSPDCPNAFVQGGRILHTLDPDTQLKPRKYEKVQTEVKRNESGEVIREAKLVEAVNEYKQLEQSNMKLLENLERLKRITASYHEDEENSLHDEIYGALDLESIRSGPLDLKAESIPTRARRRMGQVELCNDQDLEYERRDILKKFEPLTINGETLTSYSVGGFPIDMAKAAQKVQEIAPLPPARLPIIFSDDDMNFHHHFFQGLEIIIGRKTLLSIIEQSTFHATSDRLFIDLVEKMVNSPYERKDTEIGLFAKKVLKATFEMPEMHRSDTPVKTVIVASNLYGFQYIEPGMECKESDLRMWLHICYNHYRNMWFNTFKSSGVPQFAIEGVQSRYETDSKPISKRDSPKGNDTERSVARMRGDVSPTERSGHRSSHTRQRSSKSSPDRDPKGRSDSALTRIMTGRF